MIESKNGGVGANGTDGTNGTVIMDLDDKSSSPKKINEGSTISSIMLKIKAKKDEVINLNNLEKLKKK